MFHKSIPRQNSDGVVKSRNILLYAKRVYGQISLHGAKMSKSLSIAAGTIGAMHGPAVVMLLLEFLSRQLVDSLGLLLFCFAVPLGAAAGIKILAAFLSSQDQLTDDSSGSATITSSCLGCVPSWALAMMVGFAPPPVGLITVSVVPSIIFCIFIARSVKALIKRNSS